MLLQSHAGEIQLLPAIPKSWSAKGSFSGLRARGGYEVDCQWQDGKVTGFKIYSAASGKVKVRVNGIQKEVDTTINPKLAASTL
jgi:alpha-L-fucosidase 2